MLNIIRIFRGNIVGQPVFTPGPPCTRCPGGREPCRNGLCAGPGKFKDNKWCASQGLN